MSTTNVSDTVENRPDLSIDAIPSWVWVGVTVFIAVVSIGLRYTSLNHHDNAWLLYAAGEYLNGSRLYVDLVEVNPPLIVFLNLPPVWAAKLLGVAPITVFFTYVFLLATMSCGFSYFLIGKTTAINRPFLLLLTFITLFVLPRGDFGQREHFLVIFTLPYVFLIARRIEGGETSGLFAFSIGLFAVLGFGLKPYFLLISGVLELYFLYISRSVKRMLRPETLALVTGFLVYISVIVLVTPEYITKIIPIALEVYNQAFNTPLFLVIFRLELLFAIILALIFRLTLGEGRNFSTPSMTMFLAGAAAYVTYIMQMKGWSYQSYPALAFLTIASGVLIAEWGKQTCPQHVRHLTIFLGSVAIMAMPVLSMVGYRYENIGVNAWQKVIEENRPITSFYSMSSTLSTGFPAVTVEGFVWASRFPTLWMLPGIIRARQNAAGKFLPKIDEIEKYHTNAVIEDLMKFKPELIIVDVRPDKPYYGGGSFEYIKYFSKDKRFKSLWSYYEKIGYSELGFEYYKLKK